MSETRYCGIIPIEPKFKKGGLNVGRPTKYEMDWEGIATSDHSANKLSANEIRYVIVRLLSDVGPTEAIRRLGWSNRYGWDIKRSIARKYPEYVLSDQGGK